EAERRAAEDHPVAYYGGTVGGAVGTGAGLAAGGLSLGANAINAGRSLPGVAVASGIEGGLLGSLYGAGAGEDTEGRLDSARTGGTWGAGLGFLSPFVIHGASKLAQKAVTPFQTSPERVAAAQTLRAEGVPVTAGQQSGNRVLRTIESEIGPRGVYNQQQEAFTSAALRRAGINANRASPEVIDDAFRAI